MGKQLWLSTCISSPEENRFGTNDSCPSFSVNNNSEVRVSRHGVHASDVALVKNILDILLKRRLEFPGISLHLL